MTQGSSIDYNELQKFNKTYAEWWNPEGEFKMLHKINPLRVQYICDAINKHFNIDNNLKERSLCLLDVGCGGGLLCAAMHDAGLNVTGIDANNSNIKASKMHSEKNKLDIRYLHNTVEEYIKSSHKYHIITCLEVIEHVASVQDFILTLTQMLHDDGILIISTINRTVKSYLNAIIAAEYVLGLVPRNTHDYSKFIRPSELARMLQNSQYNIQELKGLSLSLPSCNWHMSDNIEVNYFAIIK